MRNFRYRIDEELDKLPLGARGKFVKALGKTRQNLSSILREIQNPTYNTMIKLTDTFNDTFGTEFTEQYLFEKKEIQNEK